MEGISIDSWDISVLVLYFLSVLAIGFVAMFTSQRGTVGGYFLAGRYMTWLPIGASLFASNIGSEHFIGLAGSGAASGIAVGAFELNASLLLQLLGWVFLPVYIASGVFTLPEYMRKRFGGVRIRIYLAALSLLLYVFTKISVNLFSGALFLKEALNWDIWPSIILLLILTSVITIAGGLTAVLYTDTLQCFVMVIGAVILAIMSFIKVGGFPGLLAKYGSAIAHVDVLSEFGKNITLSLAAASMTNSNASNLYQLANSPKVDSSLRCSLPSEKAFVLLRGVSDPDMPWLGFLFGQTPASIWYWCADQMMVQRVLAAKSLSHAQGATLMAGLIKQMPLFIMVLPGLISRVLYPDEIGCRPGDDCFRVCGQRSGCSNLAYPKLIIGIMPSGLRGLMLAVILAALVSDLTSIFNSASTMFTMDIYQRFRKRATNFELMTVGRLFVFFLVLVSIAWVPVIKELQGSQLYVYIQTVAAYLSPPIAAIYMCAILWKRCNEKGAFWGLIYGLVVGLVRLVLSVVYSEPVCGEEDTRPWLVSRFHYMYFALFSFLSSGLLAILLSLLSERPREEEIHRLTYWTAWESPLPEIEVEGSSSNLPSGAFGDPGKGGKTGVPDNGYALKEQAVSQAYGWKANSRESRLSDSKSTELVILAGENSLSFLPTEVRSEDSGGDDEEQERTCLGTTRRCLKHTSLWFCGCEDRPCSARVEEKYFGCCAGCCCKQVEADPGLPKLDKELLFEQRLQKITSLKQDPRARLALRIGLLFIVALSIFGFVFFSVFFKDIKVGPLGLTGVANNSLPQALADAIHLLEGLLVVEVE